MPELTRWDDAGPLQGEYLEDCAACGTECERSSLAWQDDELVCADCEAPETLTIDDEVWHTAGEPNVVGRITHVYESGPLSGGNCLVQWPDELSESLETLSELERVA